MMGHKRVLGIILFSLLLGAPYYLQGQEKVNWLTWQEAEKLSRQQRRKVVVDVFTDWCGWCKKMEKATFQEPIIARYINENYYAIRFNAECRESIEFNNKTYKYVKSGKMGYNELALELTNGKLSYPTIVFLDEDFKVIQPIQGFITPEKFEMVMTYFARNQHKTTPWAKYERKYVPLAELDGGN